MLNLLLLLLAAAPLQPTVAVETLDGDPRQGTLVEWQQDSLRVKSDDEEPSEIRLSSVLRVDVLRSDEHAVTNTPSTPLKLQLVDGSQVDLNEIEVTAAEAQLTLSSALFKAPQPEVALASIHWVRKQLDEAEPVEKAARLEEQWREILAMRPGGDLIVIRKPGADTLNYVEGVIGDIGKENIAFSLDEQQIEVAREKVFGWIYYRAPQTAERTDAGAAINGLGYRLMAKQITWLEGNWEVETNLLGKLQLQGDGLSSIDFSSGKVLYLSDLEPRRADWTPPPSLPLIGSLLDGYVRDRAFFAPRLSLEYPPESLDPSEATSAGISRQVEFRKGLAIRGRMELVYRLPEGFRQLRAVAGIDPHARVAGTIDLRILGDGQELLRQQIAGSDAPVDIACSVEGVQQLELVVDFGKQNPLDMGSGATLHLGQARLTK